MRVWGRSKVPEFAYQREDLPSPSAELVLFRVHVEATVAVLGRKKADRYLRIMSEALAQEENLTSVFQIRPSAQHGAVRIARRQAATIFRRYLPIWLARMPVD